MLDARAKRPTSGSMARRSLRSRSPPGRAVLESGERPGLRLRWSNEGLQRCRSWRFAVKRSSTRGPTVEGRGGREPEAVFAGGSAQTGRSRARKRARLTGERDRESDGRRSARVERRLQKSVRRIFLAAKRGSGQPGSSGTAGWLEATHQPLTRRERARGERKGARERREREQRTRRYLPELKLRGDPTEGVLVRAVFVALTRRRIQRAWRGEVSETTFSQTAYVRPTSGRPEGLGRRGLEPDRLGGIARQRASEVVLVR